MLNILKDKFIIWGCGNRGEIFRNVFGDKNIIAVIDKNSEFLVKGWHGIPIISIEEYKKGYAGYPILITPVKCASIIYRLISNNIQNFFKLDDILIPDMFDHYLMGSRDSSELIFEKIQNSRYPVVNFVDEGVYAPIAIFCRKKLHHTDKINEFPTDMDVFMVQGLNITFFLLGFYKFFQLDNVYATFIEDGFIYSLFPNGAKHVPVEYRRGHSFIADRCGIYLNARSESALENMLNSTMTLSNEQCTRARKLIVRIREEKISKYNYQPLCDIKLEGSNKKVLVVDQVNEDKSILFGLASDSTTFKEMLYSAIRENPDADIFIKTHPASAMGHYSDFPLKDYKNVHLLDYAINPISLLEKMDVVYVCTSQMGFEAVMCDKIVHTFGVPFYAGWGLTKDRVSCLRRKRKRSIEDVFYMAYIMYTRYVSYETNSPCEIEQAIDEIIAIREDYWKHNA